MKKKKKEEVAVGSELVVKEQEKVKGEELSQEDPQDGHALLEKLTKTEGVRDE